MLTMALIDDEPLARLRVKSLLAEQHDVRIVGEAGTKTEAVELLTREKPDLAVIDVQLPDGTGLEVVESLPASSMPLVIFVTAYERYAANAFDVCAIDYVMKPVRPERFLAAIEKAREAARGSQREGAAPVVRPDRLAVPSTDDRIVLISAADISYIEAAGNYVRVHWRERHQLYRESIGTVEEKLDPLRFARVHRSVIVNLDRIRQLEPNAFGDYRVILDDGTELPLSRRYRDRIHLLFGHL